jgi:hypothetical protein
MQLRRVRPVWLNRRALFGLLLIGSAICRVPAAWSGLPEALQSCTREQDDSRRLACYDREIPRLAAMLGDSPTLAPEPKPRLSAPDVHNRPGHQILSSVVSAIHERGDGRKAITLANGDTWVQGEAWEAFHVSVGDAITIKTGALGSYHLYTPSGLATRVTRER